MTAVVGSAEIQALLASSGIASDDDPRTSDRVVVGFSLDAGPTLTAQHVDALHAALVAGLDAVLRTIRDREVPLRRLVLVAVTGDAGPLDHAFAVAVGALAKSIARELARQGTTVNAVGVHRGGDAEQAAAALAGLLLRDDAGFITGQALGTAGARLGQPAPAGPADPAGGRWALVSGGAGAIGSAITRRLHEEGWHVLIGRVRRGPAEALADELRAAGPECRTVALDLQDPRAIDAVAAGLEADQSVLGCVVLCGGWNRTAKLATTDLAEGERTLAINLTGPAHLLAGLHDRLDPAGATVVGIGSDSARVGDSGRSVYAAAKAGLAGLVTGLNGGAVRAVVVSPGPVESPLLRSTHGEEDAVERGIERLRRLIPLGRLGTPEEVADAVAFATSGRGRWLAGEVLSVGGGITMQ